MAWIVREYFCSNCSFEWEDLVDNQDEDQTQKCAKCGTSNAFGMSAPSIATFSMLSPADKKASLMKRSAEHTTKEVRKTPEKFGDLGLQRARAGQIRSK